MTCRGIDALSLNTLHMMKGDLLEIIALPETTHERRSDSIALVREINLRLDRTADFIAKVTEAMDDMEASE